MVQRAFNLFRKTFVFQTNQSPYDFVKIEKTAWYGDKAMTAWTMFSWRRLWSGGAADCSEDPKAELPADTRQLVYNVYVYFSRRPGRTSKAAVSKTASATMVPRDIVADIIRDKHRE